MTQTTHPPPWRLDPDDPRAPTDAQWDAMSEQEREAVAASLPSEVPSGEAHPPEGDFHRDAKNRATEALSSFFARIGRRVYVSSELPVYYPGEPMFSADVIAVVDVEPLPRNSWLVRQEGKGLDFILEVLSLGDRHKDLRLNVQRFARLGIPEYFVLDLLRDTLQGWRLAEEGVAIYQRIVPQRGLFSSRVLGLELGLSDSKLRFYYGQASLPDADELVARLERAVNEQTEKRLEESRVLREALEEETRRRLEEEQRRQQEEQRRQRSEERAGEERAQRQAAEEQLVEALAEIERLKRALRGE